MATRKKTYTVTKGQVTLKQQVTVVDHEVFYGNLRFITKVNGKKVEQIIPMKIAKDLGLALTELRFSFVNDESFG